MALRILLVEDNEDGRESLCILLTLLGYEVETAADGLEGVRRGLASPPDVAIIDIGLPGLDGLAVGKHLREALGQDVVLVAYTAWGDPDTANKVVEAGFDVHLVKPIGLEELCPFLMTRPEVAVTPETGPTT